MSGPRRRPGGRSPAAPTGRRRAARRRRRPAGRAATGRDASRRREIALLRPAQPEGPHRRRPSSLVLLALAIVGPVHPARAIPNEFVGPLGVPPDAEWWFGTTTFGQDVFAQFVHGLGSTFIVGLLGGGLAALIGMTVGFVAGYRGGLVDEVLNMLTNVVLVIPTLALLHRRHRLPAGPRAVRGGRLHRAHVVAVGGPGDPRPDVLAADPRVRGPGPHQRRLRAWRVIFREIAPNMSSYLFMTFILLFGGAILIAASLDFIGLGPTEGISLGLMMYNAVAWSALQLGMWWWFIPPGRRHHGDRRRRSTS